MPVPALHDIPPEDAPEFYYDQGVAAEKRGDKTGAIASYKQALARKPSYREAITALGRLQYVAPEQPFMNETARRLGDGKVCNVNLEIRNPCNYRCFYCVAKGHNNTPVQLFDLAEIEKIYAGIKCQAIITAFECGGGEPTVHPQFPELVRLCSKYGCVSFPTNNSQNPERWLPKETVSRLHIRATLHPEAETKLDEYLRNARTLIDAGCNCATSFIAHPMRMAKIPEYRKIFADHGISFTPVSFIGEYEGRQYPFSYTEEEKELIGINDGERIWEHRIEPYTARNRNFRGIPCLAGSQNLYITNKGILRRCLYDPQPIETPSDSASPCEVKKCGCGLFLEKLNPLDLLFFNGVSGVMNKPKIDDSGLKELAAKLGYTSIADAMFTEELRVYETLMSAYGKDEFPENPPVTR